MAIARNFSDADIIATDICDSALKVATENIKNHQLQNRIKLLCGDLFDPIIPQLDTAKFDAVLCNPPYVSAAEFDSMAANVKDYEPKSALYAGSDGLDIYRKIADKIDDFLKPDGALILEIGYAQGKTVRELLEQSGCFTEIKIEKDHHNNDRIITAKKSLA